MVSERKVLRTIFDLTKERDGKRGINTNDELIRHKNIINHIKAQRLSWFGHLHRMPEERIHICILVRLTHLYCLVFTDYMFRP
jgi:hypothetical protein